MSGRVIAAAGVALVAATVLSAPPPADAADPVCDPAAAIEDPAPFVWEDRGDHSFGVLEYGRATFSIGGETLTTRAYRQAGSCFSIPGPTIHMTPGETYVLRFRNLLDYEAPSAVHNDFKDPNVTNLHTHGLHISGEGPGDDVTRMFAGGEGGDYVYVIPADHMGGTYWYHAHHHGSTYLQVSTGGFGLIVIDDGGDGIPASAAAMEEREVLVGYLDTAAAGTGGDELVTGTLPAGWTVNGAVGGTITLPPDTWQHWRVLLADADARVKTVAVEGACEAELLARDGVWRTTAPKDLPTNEVSMTGASRADLAVRCTGVGQLTVDGRVVASIATAGTAGTADAHPYASGGGTWSADRPSYLRDLRGVPQGQVHSESISMGARTVNGDKFDVDTPTFTLQADAVQEWTIRGATNHPFHLHVYHVQPTSTCGDFEAGEYYDTIASNCTVRFDLNAATSSPYAGMTIMHCHILAHEDQGAMTWMDVVGGEPPPTYPAGNGYAEHFVGDGPSPQTTPAAPSGLVASATSSSSIDLTWVDNADDETALELERSTGDTTTLVTLGADTTAHSDTGLSAGTTYAYRVRAVNDAGASTWSNSASATTSEVTGAVQIASIAVTTVNQGKGEKAGQATVTVVGPDGTPLPDATVTGDFRGTFTESASGTTGADGTVSFTTSATAKGGVTVEFCVTSVTHGTYADWYGERCASG